MSSTSPTSADAIASQSERIPRDPSDPLVRELLEIEGFWNESHRKAVSIGFGLRFDKILRIVHGLPEPKPRNERLTRREREAVGDV